MPVFADTGHEHPITYEYLEILARSLGIQIVRVKADFSDRIHQRRRFIEENWPEDLRQKALAVLKPTGIPFLDLCLWKGRFPSAKARFCTEHLKIIPMHDQVIIPLIESRQYRRINVWQGVRWDESRARSSLPLWSKEFGEFNSGLWNYRPILNWTASDVFEWHRKFSCPWNPLYEQGMGRVGCMPCVNCNKGELAQIAKRFPEEIERVAEWEKLVSAASHRGSSTLLIATSDPTVSAQDDISFGTHGIHRLVDLSQTSRGGRQYDAINAMQQETYPACESSYGLCE